MKKSPKYSSLFYRKSLFWSLGAIVALSILIASSSMLVVIRKSFSQFEESLTAEANQLQTQLIDILENSSRICMFFATYKTFSPVFQIETDLDIRQAVLQEEAETFISCFDYIRGISVKTESHTIQVGNNYENSKLKSVNSFQSFDISYTGDSKWSNIICLSYASKNFDEFSVKVCISSDYLSRQFLNDDTYCITSDGYILMSSQINIIGKNISEITDIKATDLFNKSSVRGYMFSKNKIYDTDLNIICLKEKKSIYLNTLPIILFLAAINLAICLLSIVLLYMILQKIYRPIEKTVQILKYYLPSDNVLPESDILFINKCCNDSDLIDENTRNTVLQIRKSQLYALYSQISPHFFGNSLETIKWAAVEKLGLDNEISNTIGILATFMDDIQEYKKMFSTISEEIEKTKEYEKLILFCYNDKLKIIWDVDESLLNYSIINFTLQPIIENSVLHGFQHNSPNAEIKVSIKPFGDNIKIVISDNGDGMEPKVLKEIENNLSEDIYASKHIGIKNVHLKLKLLYGNGFGITSIHSDANGTVVELLMKKIEYSE